MLDEEVKVPDHLQFIMGEVQSMLKKLSNADMTKAKISDILALQEFLAWAQSSTTVFRNFTGTGDDEVDRKVVIGIFQEGLECAQKFQRVVDVTHNIDRILEKLHEVD